MPANRTGTSKLAFEQSGNRRGGAQEKHQLEHTAWRRAKVDNHVFANVIERIRVGEERIHVDIEVVAVGIGDRGQAQAPVSST